ncbi:MAG: hypothetical protein LBN39_07235, partial [Planctomycetaceae bacterium]|nr:hypothetical protein [Planctomycetaceae bacterium]
AALVVFTGCPQEATVAPPADKVSPAATSTESVVEPLQPAPAEPKAGEPKKEEPKEEGAFNLVPSDVVGKVAAEAVPLPPVADLVGQVDEYIEKIGKSIEDLDGSTNYKADAEAVVRDTSGLSLVALAVGLSPEDSKYKKAAPGIIKAATALGAVDKYDDAKKAFDALKASLTSSGDPASLAWTKVAELAPVMKAVPNLSSSATRWTNTEKKLKAKIKKPEQLYGALAALAVIPQGSIANAKDTGKADQEAQWKKDCEQFRDAALKANAAAHRFADDEADYAAYWNAFKAMTDSCDSCHKTFHAAAVGKSE